MNVFLCTADDHDVVSFITHSLTPPKDSQVLIITTTVTYTPCTPSNHTANLHGSSVLCLSHKPASDIWQNLCQIQYLLYFLFWYDFTCHIDSSKLQQNGLEQALNFIAKVRLSPVGVHCFVAHFLIFRLKLEWVKKSRRNLQSSMKNIKRN